jgi:arsenical pump membrane protein
MRRLLGLILPIGLLAGGAAVVFRHGLAGDTAVQVAPAFLMVSGLLLIGAALAADQAFAAMGALLIRLPIGATGLLVLLLLANAIVTVILNLDTAVVFVTPVMLEAARRRRAPVEGFLYGSILMVNSASLLLPGSNLTNLIVVGGAANTLGFALRMLPAWLIAVAVTVVVMALWELRLCRDQQSATPKLQAPQARAGLSLTGLLVAVAVLLLLPNPAPWVLGIGVLTAAASVARGRLTASQVVHHLDPATLVGLFGITVGLGTIGRIWTGPRLLLAHSSGLVTTLIATAAALVVNNLPASGLLAATSPTHPTALLLGLDLGPNLFVTGSLSAYLWFRVARGLDVTPRLRTYCAAGAVVTIPSLILGALVSG